MMKEDVNQMKIETQKWYYFGQTDLSIYEFKENGEIRR